MPNPRKTWYKAVDCISSPGELEIIRKRTVNQPEGFHETEKVALQKFFTLNKGPAPVPEVGDKDSPVLAKDSISDCEEQEPEEDKEEGKEDPLPLLNQGDSLGRVSIEGHNDYQVVIETIGCNYTGIALYDETLGIMPESKPEAGRINPMKPDGFYQTAANKGGGSVLWMRTPILRKNYAFAVEASKLIKKHQRRIEDAMLLQRKQVIEYHQGQKDSAPPTPVEENKEE